MTAHFPAVAGLTFQLRPWTGVRGEHEPGSEYVRRYWTPTLGPTGRLAWELMVERLGEYVDLAELFAEVGVQKAEIARSTLERLGFKRVLQRRGDDEIVVAERLPRLRDADRDRLPYRLLVMHARQAAARIATDAATASDAVML